MELKPGYKETEVGMIPSNWEASTLGSFLSLQRGHDLTHRERRAGLVPVMGSAGQNGYHNVALASGPGVVLGRSGASFGQAHFCEVDFWPHNTALYVTDFQGNDPLYAFYFLRSIDFSRHNSGGAQQSLNRNFIYPIPIAIPPMPEQRAIATALSDVDALISSLDQLIAKQRDVKQAAMLQLLTGKQRLPGFNGEWVTTRLADVARLVRENVTPGLFANKLFVHFSLPAFDVSRSPVVEPGAAIGSNKFKVPPDAILVSKLNPRIPRVWAPQEIPPESVASTEFLVLLPREMTSREFLYVLCSSPEFGEQMELSATGTTGSHQRIAPNDAVQIQLSMPTDKDEQIAIAAVLSDMDAELATLEQKRNKNRALKQGMMQELLTGRIRLV